MPHVYKLTILRIEIYSTVETNILHVRDKYKCRLDCKLVHNNAIRPSSKWQKGVRVKM